MLAGALAVGHAPRERALERTWRLWLLRRRLVLATVGDEDDQ